MACLNKESNADEALAGIRAFRDESSCLVSCSRWARFSSDSPAMLVTRSADMAETATGVKIHTAKRGDELRFDYFDGNVVDEAFQSKL